LIFDLVEDCASKSGRYTEVGRSKFGEGAGEIEKAAIRSALQDSDCANYGEMPARCRETSFLVVDEDVLRRYVQGKRDCLLFTDIQAISGKIGGFKWRMNFEPRRGIFHPVPYQCRSAVVSELVLHSDRNQNAIEQRRKYVNVADHQKIPQRPGISDDNHALRFSRSSSSIFRIAARSC
jgi:hypothetical protein